MPISYNKWDHIDDSDDDEPVDAARAKPGQRGNDPAMDAFFNLSKDAPIAEIQQKIKEMKPETREELLRHEKGGLLKRMMELDPSKTYATGEIFGTQAQGPTPAKSAKAKAEPSKAIKTTSALKPEPDLGAAAHSVAPSPSSASSCSAATVSSTSVTTPSVPSATAPSTRASTDYSKFDSIPDLADIDDDGAATTAMPCSSTNPAAAALASESAKDKADRPKLPAVPPELPPGHQAFTFVRLPADCDSPIEIQTGFDLGGKEDVLPTLLAPLFKQQPGAKLDAGMVAAHVAAKYEEMKGIQRGDRVEALPDASDTSSVEDGVSAPRDGEAPPPGQIDGRSMEDLDQQTKGGVCEAWPLAPATEGNGMHAVKLYIDEVGALRKRPRNPRAEALALATGQPGLSIHGDAYVGRVRVLNKWGDEKNADFTVAEMAHDAEWVCTARSAREEKRERSETKEPPSKVVEEFAYGSDELGRYAWSQGKEDVEVRVLQGIPVERNAKRRIQVTYGGGTSLASASGK